MATKNTGPGRHRPESPLAAAARRMAEEEEAGVPPVPPPPVPTPAPAPTPAAAPEPATYAGQGETAGSWAPDDRWAPPAPEARTAPPTPPVGHSYYPPPAAPAAAPPGYGPGAGGGEPAYSPWWKRVVAVLVDWLVVGIPAGIAFAAAGNPFGTDPFTGEPTFEPSGAYLVAWLVSLVASLTYYVVMEGGPGGATLGKMAVGIQVRDASSFGPIGYGRALGRRLVAGLLWALFILPGLVNVLMPLWDRRRQTLHDKAVTAVVVERG